ncbi:hypothetical protein [Acinetobacter baumannii]|uniref:hypothetical protein n=1 Tax=Acinetobacter baumannii TaxID=470 RepID=UPI000D688EEA|nr:hypothetical protein [Acinetobacter baumannii]
MQKYIKNDLSEIRYFDLGVNVGDWIDLNEYRLMTKVEILKHESEPHTDHHVWSEDLLEWVDARTPEQISEYERSLMPALTKRQFSLHLYDIGKYDDVMNALNANPRFKIEFDTVSVIERLSPTVTAMGQILEWDDLMIDEKWKGALKL